MPPSAFATLSFVWALSASPAAAPLAEEDLWLSFIPGRFALIGQNPDHGAPYAGTAILSRQGNGFSLKRTIGAKKGMGSGLEFSLWHKSRPDPAVF